MINFVSSKVRMITKMDITERFLNYTKFDTQSQEDSDQVPSTEKQLVFANYLKKELENEGLSDVEMDDKGYIYATLKANIKGDIPTIGFISHYDTSPDCSGHRRGPDRHRRTHIVRCRRQGRYRRDHSGDVLAERPS